MYFINYKIFDPSLWNEENMLFFAYLKPLSSDWQIIFVNITHLRTGLVLSFNVNILK